MSLWSMMVVLGIVPWIWSAAVWAARRGAAPCDKAEKATLVLMLAPVFMGLAVIVIGARLPDMSPVTLPPMVEAVFLSPQESPSAQSPTEAQVVPNDLLLKFIIGLYLAVLAGKAAKLIWAQIGLWHVARRARPDGDVRLTDADIPPLALRKAVILPTRLLHHLTLAQTDLVVAHERAHQQRADTLYYPILSWLEVVFWFNLGLMAQTRRCRVAAELACDARVLKGRPDMRRDYADALLLTLKHTAGHVQQHIPAAYSPANSGEFRMRMIEIMRPSAGQSKSPRWAILGAALLLIPVAGAQLAWAQSAKPVGQAGPTVFTVMPVTGKLTSPFGMRDNPITGEHTMHNAVDIASPTGTPVYAPADGKVIRADISQPWFGYVLEIAHAEGYVTRYMHLDHIDVKVADTLTAGQVVAASGNTGRSTGPHTCIALFKDGKPIDPVGHIPLPGV